MYPVLNNIVFNYLIISNNVILLFVIIIKKLKKKKLKCTSELDNISCRSKCFSTLVFTAVPIHAQHMPLVDPALRF